MEIKKKARYEEIRLQIKEGDVFLYRGKGINVLSEIKQSRPADRVVLLQ